MIQLHKCTNRHLTVAVGVFYIKLSLMTAVCIEFISGISVGLSVISGMLSVTN